MAKQPGPVNRFIQDTVSQASGLAIVVVALIVLVAAGVGGLSLIPALGTFGYIAYAVVLCVLALGLGPMIATGVSLRQKGSASHRDAAAIRLEEQRRKFGLTSPQADRERARLSGHEPTDQA